MPLRKPSCLRPRPAVRAHARCHSVAPAPHWTSWDIRMARLGPASLLINSGEVGETPHVCQCGPPPSRAQSYLFFKAPRTCTGRAACLPPPLEASNAIVISGPGGGRHEIQRSHSVHCWENHRRPLGGSTNPLAGEACAACGAPPARCPWHSSVSCWSSSGSRKLPVGLAGSLKGKRR